MAVAALALSPAALVTFLADGRLQSTLASAASSAKIRGRSRRRDSIQRTGLRAVIADWLGWATATSHSSNILATESVPHDWLFRACRLSSITADREHCTLAFGQGCQHSVVPFFGDQFIWGDGFRNSVSGRAPSRSAILPPKSWPTHCGSMRVHWESAGASRDGLGGKLAARTRRAHSRSSIRARVLRRRIRRPLSRYQTLAGEDHRRGFVLRARWACALSWVECLALRAEPRRHHGSILERVNRRLIAERRGKPCRSLLAAAANAGGALTTVTVYEDPEAQSIATGTLHTVHGERNPGWSSVGTGSAAPGPRKGARGKRRVVGYGRSRPPPVLTPP